MSYRIVSISQLKIFFDFIKWLKEQVLFNRKIELLYLKYIGMEIFVGKKNEGSLLFVFVYDFFLDDESGDKS